MYSAILTTLIVLMAPLTTDDSEGAYPVDGGWMGFAIHGNDTPATGGRPAKQADGKWSNCFGFRGANGETYVQCRGGANGQDNRFGPVVPGMDDDPEITPEMLLDEALRSLSPPRPDIATAPPRGKGGLVGLRHFFWVKPAQWRPISQRASAGPVWAQVTATPTTLTIDPGSGQKAVVCQGPGKPYDPKESASKQRNACSLVFTRSSAGLSGESYRMRISVRWTASWVGSDGSGGPLPPLSTTTTFPIRIAEGQALIQEQRST